MYLRDYNNFSPTFVEISQGLNFHCLSSTFNNVLPLNTIGFDLRCFKRFDAFKNYVKSLILFAFSAPGKLVTLIYTEFLYNMTQ